MNIAVMHKGCGGQIGWICRQKREQILQSAHFTRMDGTHPEPFTAAVETCSKCGERVSVFSMLTQVPYAKEV